MSVTISGVKKDVISHKSLPSSLFDRVESDSVVHNLYQRQHRVCVCHILFDHRPGPLAAVIASSPMKKSRSSVPRFVDR